MKKLLIISAMSILALVGCDDRENINRDMNTIFTVVEEIGSYEYVVKDTRTGCFYIQSSTYTGYFTYSPYLGEDGKVMGCGQKDFKY